MVQGGSGFSHGQAMAFILDLQSSKDPLNKLEMLSTNNAKRSFPVILEVSSTLRFLQLLTEN